MLKTLSVDAHAMVREGLKKIHTDSPDIEVIAAATVGIPALFIIHTQSLDIVILDRFMPGRSGFEVLKIITHGYPRLSVLVLSVYSESQYALRALKARASGYLTKESAPGQLVAAIRKVASAGKYPSPSLAEKMAVGLRTAYLKNVQ